MAGDCSWSQWDTSSEEGPHSKRRVLPRSKPQLQAAELVAAWADSGISRCVPPPLKRCVSQPPQQSWQSWAHSWRSQLTWQSCLPASLLLGEAPPSLLLSSWGRILPTEDLSPEETEPVASTAVSLGGPFLAWPNWGTKVEIAPSPLFATAACLCNVS